MERILEIFQITYAENIMSTVSLNPSFAAQLHALAGTALDFVLAVKAPAARRAVKAPAVAAAEVDTTDIWALYRMNRGGDTVSPAVLRRLAAIADSK